MTRVLLVLIWACLLAGRLNAAPPQCKTVKQDGTTFEICKRRDTACESLVKEELKEPSDQWNGCAWPVTIIKGHSIFRDLRLFHIHVSVVASYRDSERMDITVMWPDAEPKYRKIVRKDVPVVIDQDVAPEKGGIPVASFDLEGLAGIQEPPGVPLVEATEKGGRKEATHSYK